MAKKVKWHDEDWLLLMQIYLQRPVGVKPMYSRKMVDLSLELHVSPEVLHDKMCQIANLETPRIEHIWDTYGNNPRRLARAVSLLREMKGFNHADMFYEGVEVNESFEKDFRPVADDTTVTPVMLILILDLYFRLTPNTMVPETPEVQDLARLLKISTQEVVGALDAFLHCDPYLNRRDVCQNRLMPACRQVWRRYGNDNVDKLVAQAGQLAVYFKSDKR